jgi:predicted component of type VI protein secretion system
VSSGAQLSASPEAENKTTGGIEGEAAAVKGACIEVMSGSQRGTQVLIDQRLKIGLGAHMGLCLEGDDRLDVFHCEVQYFDDDYYMLTDKNSGAGTVINGQQVQERRLEGGEVIMVGRTVLRFVNEGRSAPGLEPGRQT